MIMIRHYDILHHFFEDLAMQYNNVSLFYPNTEQALDISTIYESLTKMVLKDCVIKICSVIPEKEAFFTQIASLLGAIVPTTVEAQRNVTHFLIDKFEFDEKKRKEFTDFCKIPKIKVLSINWLMESYFALRKKSTIPYTFNYSFV